jgi:2-(1,2-epoxy-1,2-dihydrophenyl)acetyl-CoA isomerase
VIAERYGDVTARLDDDHVATLTLDRPPDNYFDIHLIAEVATALEALDDEPGCRAVVLTSNGKHFCAGAALGGRGGGTAGASAGERHLYDEAIRVFATAKPIVAAVRGAAIGGGLGVALAADFRVGAPESRFSANFARLGFHHGFATTVTLPAVVGQQLAADLLYTGRRIGGEEAQLIGLLDRLVPADEVVDAAHAWAAEIAASAPLAVASIRQTLRGDLVERVRRATDREKAEQDRLTATRDFAEGVRAMAERRPPEFEGR